jgi:uncharacterized protein (DUF433 family)
MNMRINWKRYIETKSEVMLGKPVIKGTRITVELILEKLAEGEGINAILESHPKITRKEIQACLSYASDVIKNEISYSLA